MTIPRPEMIAFDQGDIENSLAQLSTSQIDNLAFGAIQLDATGKVLSYSRMESQITGRDPKDVVGKNFFTEVAPCTKRPEFHGKFQEGVRKGALSAIFDYTFDYKMNPTKVRVHMKKALSGDSYWVLVKRL
ncbi:MAG TPA: photoactive yellow protein [Gemmatimonadaceae bacterium]